jgi:SAM-dependent methyltransferase
MCQALSFDLAYCEKVLYHIWDDHGDRGVGCAIEEMKRVLRPGGWMVAVEPVSLSPTNDEALDFSHLFEQAGLVPSAKTDNVAGLPEHLFPYVLEKH